MEKEKINMAFVKLFTKEAVGEEYPSALAYSIHMAYSSEEDGDYVTLNQDYGMLYTKAVVNEDNVIIEKGVKHPLVFACSDKGYIIIALRVNADGTIDESADGTYQCWYTDNMVKFYDKGMCDISKLAKISGLDSSEIEEEVRCITDIDELVIDIEDDDIEDMLKIWLPIHNTGIEVPDSVSISSPDELDAVKVKALYSDGTVHTKNVEWDTASLVSNAVTTIKGKVEHPVYDFPLACGYADPVVFRYENEWYFIATNDNTDDVGLFVRKADRIEDLFAPDVKEYLILDRDEDRQLIQTFWAPEFHMIGGELYILFAVGPKDWGPQCHMMKLKNGGSIIDANSWEDPVKVRKKDGSNLCTCGITLDMTYVKAAGRSYLVWSERYKIGSPLDSGSMIYIGEIDETNPYQLISDPVLLTRPLYGWENQYGTINNEGPYALYTEDKLYIAYSGGSAGGHSYVVGFLSIDYDDNLLDADAWDKNVTPSLTAHSVEGEYGPGHNSFYTDENGDVWIAYHAKETIGFTSRCTAIRRVHFDKFGQPVLNMSADRDLAPEFTEVSIEVTLK